METTPKDRNTIWLVLKLAGIVAIALASRIWLYEVTYLLTPPPGRPPAILGIAMIGTLIAVFGGAYWWLYLSPIKAKVEPDNSDAAFRRRRIVGAVMFVSSVCFVIGGSLDAMWHIWRGSFGDDFLWLPHQILYGSFLLSMLVAGPTLGRIILGKGDPRLRARREPALGLGALASAYIIFSLPSDLIWHQIYGLDITAWSFPHVLIIVTSSFACIAAASLLLASQKPNETVRWIRAAIIVLAACFVWNALQLAAPEYEWSETGVSGPAALRAAWVYPVAVFMIGSMGVTLASSLSGWAWSATLMSLVVFGARIVWGLGASTLPIDNNLKIASHAYLILPAIAFDLAYARLKLDASLTARQRLMRAGLVYWAVFWPVVLVVMSAVRIGLPMTIPDVVVGAALGLAFQLAYAIGIPGAVSRLYSAHAETEEQIAHIPAVPAAAAGD